jgi:signal transduction histidine kinase
MRNPADDGRVELPIPPGIQRLEETMLRKITLTALSVIAMAIAGAALAQGQFGTGAEAKAMLDKAVTELKANEATALAKFNKGEAGFKDRDLYVFCYEMNTGKFTAHVNQSLLGTDVKALKEKDGSPLGEKVFNATKPGTTSTVSYNFPKPGTTEPVAKESYVTQVGNQGCGVGYYK